MFLIERDAPTTEAIFKSLDDFLKSALIITDPSQANLIGQVQSLFLLPPVTYYNFSLA